jgi:hypothetical protein
MMIQSEVILQPSSGPARFEGRRFATACIFRRFTGG